MPCSSLSLGTCRRDHRLALMNVRHATYGSVKIEARMKKDDDEPKQCERSSSIKVTCTGCVTTGRSRRPIDLLRRLQRLLSRSAVALDPFVFYLFFGDASLGLCHSRVRQVNVNEPDCLCSFRRQHAAIDNYSLSTVSFVACLFSSFDERLPWPLADRNDYRQSY